MRRFLGSKDFSTTTSSNAKGKQRQRDPSQTSASASTSLPDPVSTDTRMEVHVRTEVHSSPPDQSRDHGTFHPLASTSTLAPTSSPASSGSSKPLPPGIRVPTHPYPYWHNHSHTPSSSSQSSLESPVTPSHVNWLNGGVNNPHSSSSTNLDASSAASAPSSTHALVLGRSSPNPHFPPPPSTNPPPNLSARPKLVHPIKSTHSLRAPVQEFYGQQLSPIVEQDYLSPEKRPISLPSSSHDATSGTGSRSSTAHTARTSAAMMTPVSPASDGVATATVTPVSPVPMTSVLVGARGTLHMQAQMHTPVTPSYSGGVVPFARRREEDGNESPRESSCFSLALYSRLIGDGWCSRYWSVISSTRTHQSSGSSATPPVIPPLDLKPEFRGQAFLTTPTSLDSRGFLEIGCAGFYDDDSVSDRRESFVTARTGAGRESRYSVGQEGEIYMDAEEDSKRDSGGTVHPPDHRTTEDSYQDTPPRPQPDPLPHEVSKVLKPPLPAYPITHPRPSSRTSSSPPSYNYPPDPQSSDYHSHYHPHRPTPSSIPHDRPPHSGVSAPSLQYIGRSPSASSSFIDRRFAPSSLYLDSPSERESTRKTGAKWKLRTERVDTIQVLFWVGFIAPWCWLIGGWLVPPKPSARHGFQNGASGGSGLLPLWTGKSTSTQGFDASKIQHGYPFVAPSVLSLTPPSYTHVVLTPKPSRGVRNPWVRRCRVAAFTSGVIIVAAFVVALVVVGTNS
ncbi:hypothetical protein PAXRUDRAFT_498154 [Paxillus rubicundulus Ve08.2h10]|uniref:Uncharacterized protein n=1 Tax=Paxillus rubicundulus Ve08.2h10 TaxID=930991 RepID=A0A0D0E4Y3_9AGAM|nr:hypothetical protein PAXRUDRAFT_498154 [Paxillus rubicundulus Ve08.2h10]